MTEIRLDREDLYTCSAAAKDCPESQTTVIPTAKDKERDVIVFVYTVSAGKIKKIHNSEVIWDLTGLPAGKYSITVGTDDGCASCGRTMTKTVELKTPPAIKTVSFSRSEVTLVCPFAGIRSNPESMCSKEGASVDVSVVSDNVGDTDVYYYTVTGGRILGSGANVKWDFSDARRGQYKLFVGIGRGRIIYSNTASNSIYAKECPVCDPPCECATLSTFGPAFPVKRGQTVVFSSKVDSLSGITQKWTISAGTILNDPTSSSIMVKIPDDLKDPSIIATVELFGTSPFCNCPKSDSITVFLTGNENPGKEL